MRWGAVLGVISEVQEARRDGVITIPELIEIGQAVGEALELDVDLGFTHETIGEISDLLDQRSPIHELTSRLASARSRFDDVELDNTIDSAVSGVVGGFLDRKRQEGEDMAAQAAQAAADVPLPEEDVDPSRYEEESPEGEYPEQPPMPEEGTGQPA